MTWRSRFLAWVTPILLLAQLALVVHQLEHRIAPQTQSTTHECALCSLASGAAPPPGPIVVLPPDLGQAIRVVTADEAACCAHVDRYFQSRAPPAVVAI